MQSCSRSCSGSPWPNWLDQVFAATCPRLLSSELRRAEPGHGNSHHSAAGLLANEATLLYSRVVLLTAMVTTSNSFRVSKIQLRCQPRTVYLSLYLILPIDVIYFP